MEEYYFLIKLTVWVIFLCLIYFAIAKNFNRQADNFNTPGTTFEELKRAADKARRNSEVRRYNTTSLVLQGIQQEVMRSRSESDARIYIV